MNVKVFKNKHTSRWVVLLERTSSMLDEIGSKTVQNDRESDQPRKKTLSEIKLVENVSKNLKSFLEITPVQKKVLISHKLQDHAYEWWNLFRLKITSHWEIDRINGVIQVCVT